MAGAKRGPKPREVETATPLPGIPPAPSHLSGPARKHWKAITAKLHAAGLLSELDADILATYCAHYARWLEAEEKIKAEGAVIVARNGYAQPNPWYTISVQCTKDLRSLAESLGLSPRARTRVKVAEAEVVDEKWGEF